MSGCKGRASIPFLPLLSLPPRVLLLKHNCPPGIAVETDAWNTCGPGGGVAKGQSLTILWTVCVLRRSVMPDSLRPHGLQPTRLLCPWGFSRQEYWSGLPYPSPGYLLNPGIKPRSPQLHTVDSTLGKMNLTQLPCCRPFLARLAS